MLDRGFNEVDVRHLLGFPTLLEVMGGGNRWRVEGQLRGARWTVVVEPDNLERVIVVVTAWKNSDGAK